MHFHISPITNIKIIGQWLSAVRLPPFSNRVYYNCFSIPLGPTPNLGYFGRSQPMHPTSFQPIPFIYLGCWTIGPQDLSAIRSIRFSLVSSSPPLVEDVFLFLGYFHCISVHMMIMKQYRETKTNIHVSTLPSHPIPPPLLLPSTFWFWFWFICHLFIFYWLLLSLSLLIRYQPSLVSCLTPRLVVSTKLFPPTCSLSLAPSASRCFLFFSLFCLPPSITNLPSASLLHPPLHYIASYVHHSSPFLGLPITSDLCSPAP